MQLSIAEPAQSAELRDAFLHHLPQRLKTLLRRARAQSRGGWDINILHLVQDEVANLAGACGRYGQIELGERLLSLESALAPWTQSQQVPDAAANAQIDSVLNSLRPHLEADAPAWPRAVPARVFTPEPVMVDEADGYQLHETPPVGHWRTLGAPDFEPPPAANEPAAPAAPVVQTSAAEGHSVYLLGGDDPLLNELTMRLESRGCTVTPLEDVASLIEVLGALPPQLVVVGARHAESLDHVGPVLRASRASASHKVAMLALLNDGDVSLRLRALRAGADRCISLPAQSEEIVERALDLLSDEEEEPYRILIVEDDASQALFAESILRKAGMVTQVLNEPIAVLEELDRFQPDLLLMDLNMPGCDGLELTALIREREGYVSTPIVFLSGDPDADRQFAALDAGGDDFLSKPIRPKYLVSAVTNRVRRARASLKHTRERRKRDPATGLHGRAQLLDALNERFAAAGGGVLSGGVLCAEVDGATALRTQVGLTVLDEVLAETGAFIARHIERDEMVARFGDAGFLVLSPRRDEEGLAALAQTLRAQIARERFGGKALPVELSCGVCAFGSGLSEAGAVLAAAERALDAARRDRGGIGLYSRLGAIESGMRSQLEAALRADAFHLIFQPIAPLAGAAEPQYQALLRLRDSSSGELYSAAQLIPEATRAGLIGAIDDWVLRRCLALLAERERGGARLRLFVSQSLEGWKDPARVAALRQQLPASGISRGSLALEFRHEEARAQLRTLIDLSLGLRELGVKLSLAGVDRETVAAGLLEHLPLDFIKLAPGCEADATDLAGLVQAAHEHGRQVIAPRVEDAAAAVRLCAAGVDFLQGNFVQQAGQALDYDFTASAQ
ncbi:MAG TPA: EAL domain-containing protein [Rhodanobacteraceae bacterium]|nr:EAL domain-containing protein [Rhodanobacteraceae bacterium]